jgi:hypothetical protein
MPVPKTNAATKGGFVDACLSRAFRDGQGTPSYVH